jgi:hypothetical protein
VKGEGYSLHIYCRDDRANQTSIQGEEIQFAIDKHFQGFRIASGKLVIIGECCDIDASAGFRLYGRPHFGQAFMQGAVRGLIMELPQLEIGCSNATADQGHSACQG